MRPPARSAAPHGWRGAACACRPCVGRWRSARWRAARCGWRRRWPWACAIGHRCPPWWSPTWPAAPAPSLPQFARGRPVVAQPVGQLVRALPAGNADAGARAAARTGIAFLFVNQGESDSAVRAYLSANSLPLREVLLDGSSQALPALGSRGLPTTLFFDAQGRLVDAHFGVLNAAALQGRLRDCASSNDLNPQRNSMTPAPQITTSTTNSACSKPSCRCKPSASSNSAAAMPASRGPAGTPSRQPGHRPGGRRTPACQEPGRAAACRLRFVAAGAQAIPLPDASFDLALMLKSLHHVPLPLLPRPWPRSLGCCAPAAISMFRSRSMLAAQRGGPSFQRRRRGARRGTGGAGRGLATGRWSRSPSGASRCRCSSGLRRIRAAHDAADLCRPPHRRRQARRGARRLRAALRSRRAHLHRPMHVRLLRRCE